MAGDYICIDHELIEKPEVLAIHEHTGVPVDAIIGRLVMLWRLVDRQSTDGVVPLVGPVGLAQRCSGDAAFWTTVAEVAPDWLIINEAGVTIPHFSERFGESARTRMKEAVKKRKQRGRNGGQQGDSEGTEQGQQGGRGGGRKGTPVSVSIPVSESAPESESKPESESLVESSRVDHLNSSSLKEKEIESQVREFANRHFPPSVFPNKSDRDREFFLKLAALWQCGKIPETCIVDGLEAIKHRQAGSPTNPAAYYTEVTIDWLQKNGYPVLGKLLVGVRVPDGLATKPQNEREK